MTERLKFVLASAGVLALIVSLSVNNASAAMSSPPTGTVTGLIVQYGKGVSPRLSNGLASASRLSSVPLTEVRALGGGMHLVAFEHPVSVAFAQNLSSSLKLNPDVVAASPDRYLSTASAIAPRAATSKILVSSSVKPSAVRSLKAIDAWNLEAPEQTKGLITWRKPTSLSGGKLAFYRVEASTDSGKTFRSFSKTADSALELSGLTPGRRYLFRVAAVVVKSKRHYLGKFSNVSLTMTSAPRAPIVRNTTSVGGQVRASWLTQSKFQTGGLSTTYRAKVSSAGGSATCDTAASSCLVDLAFGSGDLQVEVIAKNSRGTASSQSAQKPADQYFAQQWYLNGEYGANVQNAWPVATGKVIVAVIDSGITDHPDLDDALIKNADGKSYGFDFVSNLTSAGDGDGWDSDPADPGETAAQGSSWHGTHVTGLIAAQQNSFGISGVAPNAQIVEVRALGRTGGRLSDLMAALRWSAGIKVPNAPINTHPARVINFSIASESDLTCDSISAETFRQIAQKGVVVVTASGNRGINAAESFPANCPGIITVGASNFKGELATYSNFGSALDIVAPGGESADKSLPSWQRAILSTFNDGQSAPTSPTYAYVSGTSMAAPIVSGAIALMLEVNPRLTTSLVQKILSKSAGSFAPSSRCYVAEINCGPGILDTASAVELAAIYSW